MQLIHMHQQEKELLHQQPLVVTSQVFGRIPDTKKHA